MKVEPVKDLSPEVEQALYTLVAMTLSKNSFSLMFSVQDVQYQGFNIGTWEVQVRRAS